MVYKATIIDSRNENVPAKLVALKKYKDGFGQKPYEPYDKERAVKLLKKEAVLVKNLFHENTIHLHGFCTDDEYFGLLLELCEGELVNRSEIIEVSGKSLQKFCFSLDPKESLPLEVLINWASQIASGMAFLRERRMLHRDLKADNSIIDFIIN